MRFRHLYMLIGSIGVLCLWLLSDPDLGLITALPFGASTLAMIIVLSKTVLYTGALHISRKGLLDYVDVSAFFEKALETPQSAGSALIAIAIIMLSISLLIYAAVVG